MGRMEAPGRQVCPLCGRDDLISTEATGPSLWQHTCSGTRNHPDKGPFGWVSAGSDRIQTAEPEGKAASTIRVDAA